MSPLRWLRVARHLPELHELFLAHRRWVNRLVQDEEVSMSVRDWRDGARLLARGQGLLNAIDGDPR